MNDEFLLVHKSILPEYYDKIIQAREQIEGGNQSISEVCRELGISRNTYYKYKNFVFRQPESETKKIILSFKVSDVSGVLSEILLTISQLHGNVLTINQDMPIRHNAYITIMVDRTGITTTLDQFTMRLRQLENVHEVEVISYE